MINDKRNAKPKQDVKQSEGQHNSINHGVNGMHSRFLYEQKKRERN